MKQKSDDENIIKDMEEKRLKNNLSIRALSKLIDVSFSSLARLERGIGNPNEETRAKILHWLGKITDQELNETLSILSGNQSNIALYKRIEELEERLSLLESIFISQHKER